MAPIIAVAFELWVTEPGYTFDSILLGKGEQGLDAAAAYMRQVWRPRFRVQVGMVTDTAQKGMSLFLKGAQQKNLFINLRSSNERAAEATAVGRGRGLSMFASHLCLGPLYCAEASCSAGCCLKS